MQVKNMIIAVVEIARFKSTFGRCTIKNETEMRIARKRKKKQNPDKRNGKRIDDMRRTSAFRTLNIRLNCAKW